MGEGPTEEGKAQEAWKEAPWSLKNCPPWSPTPTSTTIPGGVLKICVKRIHGHPINIQQCSLLTNLHQNTEIYHSLSVNIHTRCWFTFVLISAKAGWLSFKALRKPFKKRVNRDNTKFCDKTVGGPSFRRRPCPFGERRSRNICHPAMHYIGALGWWGPHMHCGLWRGSYSSWHSNKSTASQSR